MASILKLPIPPRPDYFGPDGAPPGVALQLDAFDTLDDGFEWLASRPTIRPRLGVVHTNAANNEGSLQSSINWGRRTDVGQGRNTTKPHYHVNEPQPTKVLATNLRGIANSTSADLEASSGEVDVSFWSYAIETADTGILADPGVSDFLEPGQSQYGPVTVPHAEIVARIFAYESIVWSHPIEIPDEWNDAGIVTHTWPYPYPHYTTQRGKTCPGAKKIDRFQRQIVARAQMIRDAWTADTGTPEVIDPPEADMLPLVRVDGYADQFMLVPISDQRGRTRLGYTDEQPVVVQCDAATLEAQLSFTLTPL